MIKGLFYETEGNPAVGSIGPVPLGNALEGKEKHPWEGRSPCEVRMTCKMSRELFGPSCLRQRKRMEDK